MVSLLAAFNAQVAGKVPPQRGNETLKMEKNGQRSIAG